MKDRAIKCLLEGGDGRLCDVTGDVLGVFGPQFVAQIGNVLIWH